MNKVVLVGNLGKDPAFTLNGRWPICLFSLATNKRKRNKQTGKWENKAIWHNIKCWDPDMAKDLKKGDRVRIIGHIEYNEYEKDGIQKSYTNIVAEEVVITNAKMYEVRLYKVHFPNNDNINTATQKTNYKTKNNEESYMNDYDHSTSDDIPF